MEYTCMYRAGLWKNIQETGHTGYLEKGAGWMESRVRRKTSHALMPFEF